MVATESPFKRENHGENSMMNGVIHYKSEEPKKRRTGDHGPQPAKVQPPPPIQVPISFDEEGFEDRLLYGGPNIKLSYAHSDQLNNPRSVPLHITTIPDLLYILLMNMAPLFDRILLNIQQKSDVILLDPPLDGKPYPLPPMSDMSLFATIDQLALFERALQCLVVIHNFALMKDVQKDVGVNVLVFAKSDHLLLYLTRGIALPSGTHYLELKRYCLSILEELAPHLAVRPGHRDWIVTCVSNLIFSNDIGLILPALRILTALANNEANEPCFANPEEDLMKRLIELLLTYHEEMVPLIVDYLYQLSSLGGGTARAILGGEAATNSSGARLRVLVKMLSYTGRRQLLSSKTSALGGSNRSSRSNLLQHWLRTCFVFDAASQLSQLQFLKHYESWIASQQHPVRVNPADAWNLFKQSFPNNTEENGVIIGVKYQQAPPTTTPSSAHTSAPSTPIPPKLNTDGTINHPDVNGTVDAVAGVAEPSADDTDMADAGLEFLDLAGEGVSSTSMKLASITGPAPGEKSNSDAAPSNSNVMPIPCWWARPSSNDSNAAGSAPPVNPTPQDPTCNGPFETDAELLQHILSKHVQSDDQSPLLTCQWRSCDYVCPTDDKRQLFAHVKTHMPFSSTPSSSNSSSKVSSLLSGHTLCPAPIISSSVIAQLSNHYASTQEKEMKYVPLTTLYVLRNMARAGVDLAAIEPDLIKWADGNHFVGSSPGLLYESLRNI
ncbi:hypothetical protein SeLEV6574_g02777 [Synchytrium endobioticum]|nr:hypothetical protein SeLEV6574_g02777 [Synchytrium endobioticum]